MAKPKQSLTAAAKILGQKGGNISGRKRIENVPKKVRQKVAAMGGRAKAAQARRKGK